jgi:hypothetical protein
MNWAGLVLSALLIVPSQEHSGKVHGRITTKGGEPIGRIKVILEYVDASGRDKTGYSSKTDKEGVYAIENVKPGLYELHARKEGWADWKDRVLIDEGDRRQVEVNAVMRLTTWRKVTGSIQAGAVVYVFCLGVLVLAGNFFIAPQPSKPVGLVGWLVMAISVGVAFAKWTPGGAVLLAVVAGCAGMLIQRFGKKVALSRQLSYEAESREQSEWKEAQRERTSDLVGKKGTTTSALKPYGQAKIEGLSVEVKSARGMIGIDSRVVVTEIEDGHPVVEAAE